MKRDIKKIWIDALTSGKYKQTDGALKKNNKYCCLGVLCDLHRQMTGKGEWTKDCGDLQYSIGEDFESAFLPEQVMKWAGLKSENGIFTEIVIEDDEKYPEETTLASKNDDGSKFKEIAEFIEKYF